MIPPSVVEWRSDRGIALHIRVMPSALNAQILGTLLCILLSRTAELSWRIWFKSLPCVQADLHRGLRGLGQRAQRRPGPHAHRPHRHRRARAGRQPPLGRGLVRVSISGPDQNFSLELLVQGPLPDHHQHDRGLLRGRRGGGSLQEGAGLYGRGPGGGGGWKEEGDRSLVLEVHHSIRVASKIMSVK